MRIRQVSLVIARSELVASKKPRMRKLNVVYFGIPTGPVEWYQPIREAIAAQHHLTSYDPNGPLQQFAAADAVVDLGGATREMMEAAPKAGLWQIFGTGVEHIDLAYLKSIS